MIWPRGHMSHEALTSLGGAPMGDGEGTEEEEEWDWLSPTSGLVQLASKCCTYAQYR